MKTSDNRPAIRFTGCTDAWHHCQFNDIVITHPTKQFIKEPSLDGTIEVIQQGNEPVVGYANGSPFEEYASVTVFGDHTVSIYKPKKPFFVATDGTKILSGNNIEGNFFYFLLERYKPIPEGYKRHFTILIEHECNFPKSDEQKHIAQYMLYLDDLIERNKRKYEKLVNLKNAMLDKMFPKNGELVPEVRFAGFSGNWERRKLGEIVNRVVRKNTDNASSLALTISAQHGLVDQGNYFNNRVASQDVSNYYLIRKGEFAYNKSSSDGSPFGVVKRLDLYDMGVLSTLYIVFEIKDPNSVNTDYLSVFFDTNRWHKEVSTRASEGARNHGLLNISATDFLDIEINVPREYDEQEKLGEFFMKLAHLIDRYEQGLMSLRNLKSAFLDKMFV